MSGGAQAPGQQEHPATSDAERFVLLVIAEPDTAQVLEQAFAFHGYAARRAGTAADALAATLGPQASRPAAVILDMSLPGADGLVLCADLRARLGPQTPIIVCGDAEDRREALLAFRLGADDFVAKPFDIDDIMARAEAALRRRASTGAGHHSTSAPPSVGPAPEPLRAVHSSVASTDASPSRATVFPPPGAPDARPHAIEQHQPVPGPGRATPVDARRAPSRIAQTGTPNSVVGNLALDHTYHRVTVGGRDVRLSRSEFLLLGALMSRPDELLSRLDLARAVWGDQLASVGRPIDQHMYRLRAKLQQAADAAGVPVPAIVSVPGFGYRLIGESEPLRAAG